MSDRHQEPDDRACLTQATRYAEGMALTERARGRGDEERAWLDMLALLERVVGFSRHPEPVKPTEALRSAIWDTQDGYSDTLRHEQTERVLSAVLALWPGRSVAEVKAEALWEFVARVQSEFEAADEKLGHEWASDGYRHGFRSALLQVTAEADRIERGES